MKRTINTKFALALSLGLATLSPLAAQAGAPTGGQQITIEIPNLPAGKSFDIAYDTLTLNPGGDLNPVYPTESVSNQGTVSGNNFATVLTDDPAVGGSADPTVTQVPINDLVSLGLPGPVAAAKETATPISGISLSDIDATSFSISLSATKGTIMLSGSVPGGLTAGAITSNGTANVSANGTPAQFAATLGAPNGVIYTGNLNLVGMDSIGVLVSDNGTTGFNNVGFDPSQAVGSIPVNISGNSLDIWRNNEFSASDLSDPGKEATVWGDEANPDNDIFANCFEFLHGLDPNAGEFTPQVVIGKNTIGPDTFATYTFKKRIDITPKTLNVDVSGNRTSGFAPTANAPATNPIDPSFEEVTYQDDVPVTEGTPRFGKLRIE